MTVLHWPEWLPTLLLLLLLAFPAAADMFPDGSNATPAARGNLGTGPIISAHDYGADGTGVTNASAALITACTAAATAGKPLGLAGSYKISANTSLACDLRDEGGSQLLPDTGITVTHTGAVYASDTAYLFGGLGTVVLSTAPYVSVQWWGALHGIADDAVAFRRATGSNRIIKIPPGSYVFRSTQLAPKPPYGQAFIDAGWQIGSFGAGSTFPSLTDITIEGYGAKIMMADAVNISSTIRFWAVKNIKVFGLEMQGNRTGISTTLNNGAFSQLNVVNIKMQDIHLTGNWGGRSKFTDGNWVVNGSYENLTLDAAGVCFDVAFMKDLYIRNLRAVGANPAGEQNPALGLGGGKCIGTSYDHVNAAVNVTGFDYDDTDGFTVVDSFISNYASGAGLFAGQNFVFSGNIWDNNTGALTNTNIIDAVWSGGNVTFITSGNHGIVVGAGFTVTDMVPVGYNGAFVAGAGTAGTTIVAPLAIDPGPATVMGFVSKPAQGHAITIGYLTAGKYDSTDHPVKNVTISDTIMNTGLAVAGRGIFIAPSLIVNGDKLGPVKIRSHIYNNATIGIGANASNSMEGIDWSGSTFGGAAQVADVDTLLMAGMAPTLSSCGTTPAILGTDRAGLVQMGTGSPTGCVITFKQPYTNLVPYCVVTWIGSPLAVQSYVTSLTSITTTQTATSSNRLQYVCSRG